MSNIDKQALTDEAIKKAFAGTNFGRDDFKNILAETVIDAAAGWRCGYTATTICTHLGLLTPKGCASALGFRFISEHVQRETKRLKDELEAAEKRIAELQISRDKCFLSGLKTGWEYGIADDTEGYNREIDDAQAVIDRAAGIGVKGE